MTSPTHRNGKKHPHGAGLLLSLLLVLTWALPAPASGAGPGGAARPSFFHPRAASEPGRTSETSASAGDRASIPRAGRAPEDPGAALRLREVRVAETALTAGPALPHAFALSQNYPNPFNPSTTITFEVPGGEAAPGVQVALAVFDLRGRRVHTLVEADLEHGRYTVAWDGRDDRGARGLSMGVGIQRRVENEQRSHSPRF